MIFRNVGAIGATQLAERGSTILLASTKWSVFGDAANMAFLGAGLISKIEGKQ